MRTFRKFWLRMALGAGAGGILLSPLLFGQTDLGNFRVPDVNDQGVLESLLTGEKARLIPGEPMRIEGLVIEVYEPDGETVRIRMTSPGCFWDTQKNVATSDEPVKIVGNDFRITGTGYVYDSHSGRMQIRSESRVIFKNLSFTQPLVAEPGSDSEAP